jgi:hypothetical protein
MVGNRVESTFSRAGLVKSVGKDWFFPSVEQAVQHCIRHQHIKRVKHNIRNSLRKSECSESGEPAREDSLDISVDPASIRIDLGNEVGITNERTPGCTTIFITLSDSLPMLMSDIAAVFKNFDICVAQASIEDNGKKHTYQVKHGKTGLQLNAYQRHRLNDEIDLALGNAWKAGREPASALRSNECSKLQALEDQIQSLNQKTVELEDAMVPTTVDRKTVSPKWGCLTCMV